MGPSRRITCGMGNPNHYRIPYYGVMSTPLPGTIEGSESGDSGRSAKSVSADNQFTQQAQYRSLAAWPFWQRNTADNGCSAGLRL
jgi:hypothetical protein